MSVYGDDDGSGGGATPIERARRWIDEVLDATGTTGRALLAGCLLVGLGLGTLLWLTRQEPPPVESGLPLLEPSSVTTTTVTTVPDRVIVHVAGAVAAPGVQELPAGARVIDAVRASGGFAPDADPSMVNLAAEAVDGSQIYVPAVGETPPAPLPSASAPGGEPGPIDLNTADAAALDTLPGVGPATATAIIEHRDRHGPFSSVEDLLDVSGIGEAKLGRLRDLVTV